ncbi:helix-turn-helix domain-containing protein [Trichodesmium erythraeum]|uniref:helix-turn-helix domain-containing protein n=1 Tax=Trichodesmium erythraeum TaxID=1206 RepID=UPI0003231166|nr:helix-turn-helix domain-containing protein [Trichodesmium erythraeum GBRTRLIN201]
MHPTKEQAEKIDKILDMLRYQYNYMLAIGLFGGNKITFQLMLFLLYLIYPLLKTNQKDLVSKSN